MKFGKPIATPSANITGKPSGVEYSQIIKDFEGNKASAKERVARLVTKYPIY